MRTGSQTKPTVSEVYELLGRLATEFSTLEQGVKLLLYHLLAKGPLPPLFIHDLSFHSAIERCQKEAKIRFVGDPKQQDQIKALMARVFKTKQRRNDFIHGRWIINERLLPCIPVHSYELRWDETLQVWESLKIDNTSVSALKGELAQVDKLLRDVSQFIDSIK